MISEDRGLGVIVSTVGISVLKTAATAASAEQIVGMTLSNLSQYLR